MFKSISGRERDGLDPQAVLLMSNQHSDFKK
jgi:hypothetical protein